MDLERMQRQRQLWEETREWIRQNPKGYGKFVELALEKVAQKQKFGIGALCERVRWDANIWFKGTDFKIPNAYRRYIALHMMLEHPAIEDFCTTKKADVSELGQVSTLDLFNSFGASP
jgi:hypothetical protein